MLLINTDINECFENIAMCSIGCNNTLGSFYCYCNEGYMLDSDDRTCVGKYCNKMMFFNLCL